MWKWNVELPLVVVAFFAGSQAHAAGRCEANLSRINPEFCLNESHTSDADPKLNYSWQVSDDDFALTFKSCFAPETIGDHSDLVLALDKSLGASFLDAGRQKAGPSETSIAKFAIEHLYETYQATPDRAPKVGLVLFSAAGNCKLYQGGAIQKVSGQFPCLFLPATSVANAAHRKALLDLLDLTEGVYSDNDRQISADYTIVADLLENNSLSTRTIEQLGVIFLSDGRPFHGLSESEQTYPYLHYSSYTRANERAATRFSQAAFANTRLAVGLIPTADPFLTTFFKDAYETMCNLPEKEDRDCTGISYSDSATWPVNQLKPSDLALKLVATRGGGSERVGTLRSRDQVNDLLQALRKKTFATQEAQQIEYAIDGGDYFSILPKEAFARIESVAFAEAMRIDLRITTEAGQYAVPLGVSLKRSEDPIAPIEDQEMLCTAGIGDPLPFGQEEPQDRTLLKIQGGSASCGVVGENFGGRSGIWLLILLPLLLSRGKRAVRALAPLVGVAFALSLMSETSIADSAKGLNANHFRPVIDGIGTVETAKIPAQWQVQAGLVGDYANDAVELGADRNKRVSSVMDDVVTYHALFNLGLFRNGSVGLHIPYVQRTDLDRQGSTDEDTIRGSGESAPADGALWMKYRVHSNRSFALAVQPGATLPIGEEEKLTGDGSASPFFHLLLSGDYGRISHSSSLGYIHRQDVVYLADERSKSVPIRGHVLLKSGATYFVLSSLGFGGDIQMKFSAGEAIDFGRSNPAEWHGFGTYSPIASLMTQFGVGTGLGKGYGAPDYRVFAGVSYVPDALRPARRPVLGRPKPHSAKKPPVATIPAKVQPARGVMAQPKAVSKKPTIIRSSSKK